MGDNKNIKNITKSKLIKSKVIQKTSVPRKKTKNIRRKKGIKNSKKRLTYNKKTKSKIYKTGMFKIFFSTVKKKYL